MSAFYCDGNSYSILTVDSINNCKNHYLFDSYAGDECDTTRATELIIKDENRDGYEELYFYYKEEKTTLSPLNCSKKFDLITMLMQ